MKCHSRGRKGEAYYTLRASSLHKKHFLSASGEVKTYIDLDVLHRIALDDCNKGPPYVYYVIDIFQIILKNKVGFNICSKMINCQKESY